MFPLPIVIAGAGIGGLTAGLALAQRGLRSIILDQAERFERVGAGVQLSPNATRILIALGLADRLRDVTVAPEAIRVLHADSAHEIVRIPLGDSVTRRYGAPYWVIHRGDLQAVLLDAARQQADIGIDFGVRVRSFANHAAGVTVSAARARAPVELEAAALIGADGMWSVARSGLGDASPPRFAGRVAWRATVPADMVAAEMRAPLVTLWLGREAHVVHYPVQGGRTINIVAIAADGWDRAGWTTDSAPREVMARFASGTWSRHARDLLGIPDHWQKWALHERTSPTAWGREQTTLLGDAAHPVLPFLAQGAAMAIEDAAVLAARLAAHPQRPADGLRVYERERRTRTLKVQRAARSNGSRYHFRAPGAQARNLVMRALGGERILHRYDWIYGWRADMNESERATA